MSGRIRTIKPEAHLDEDLWDLASAYPCLHLFQAFSGLWCQADREGRFEWRPRQLKAAILPYWEGDFSHVLLALESRGFTRRYRVGDREFGVIPTFKNHQFINNKEPASKLPEPVNLLDLPEPSHVEHVLSSRARRVNDAPIPSSSPSISLPDPDPRGGVGEGEPEAPEVEFDRFGRCRMHLRWRPSQTSVDSVAMFGVQAYAVPYFVGAFVGHFAETAEACTDAEWNQRWQKWVQRDWRDPAKRPPKPTAESADGPAAEARQRELQAQWDAETARLTAEASAKLAARGSRPDIDPGDLTAGIGE